MHSHGRPGIRQFEVHACLPMLQTNNDLEQPGARGHLPDSHTVLMLKNSLAKGFGMEEDSPIVRGYGNYSRKLPAGSVHGRNTSRLSGYWKRSPQGEITDTFPFFDQITHERTDLDSIVFTCDHHFTNLGYALLNDLLRKHG
jgi:hypothetical protein